MLRGAAPSKATVPQKPVIQEAPVKFRSGKHTAIVKEVFDITTKHPETYLIPFGTVFVATGTGVAPFIAMMGHIWDRGLDRGREFHMVFGVRYVQDLIYRDLIEKWEREHRNFHFYPTISRPETSDWKGRVGYVQKILENEIKDHGRKQVFICGLHDMVEDVNNLCKRLGFAYVRFEKWD